jgi:hypothetical protein
MRELNSVLESVTYFKVCFVLRDLFSAFKRKSDVRTVLASSMKLEYPLNDALPNTTSVRDRYLAKIFQFRRDETHSESGPIAKDEDYALFYAYALVTGQIAEEITIIGREIEGLFGILDEEMLRLQ